MTASAAQPTSFGVFLKSYFSQFKEILKHPKLLLPSIILVVIWVVLGILQNHLGSLLPLKYLNFLTYAQGGCYGGVIGAIGGILGKVVVAAFVNVMIAPLFQGKNPFKDLGASLGQLGSSFKKESAIGLAPFLKGLGWALVFYTLFNWTMSAENTMVGIISAVAAVIAIGRKGGFLWGLVFGIAGSLSKGKIPSQIQIMRFLTGLSIGFAAGVALTFTGLFLAFPAGIVLIIVSLVMKTSNKEA